MVRDSTIKGINFRIIGAISCQQFTFMAKSQNAPPALAKEGRAEKKYGFGGGEILKVEGGAYYQWGWGDKFSEEQGELNSQRGQILEG